MGKKAKKFLWGLAAVAGVVAGAFHVFEAFGGQPLAWFNSYGGASEWVQGIAGALTVIFIVKAKWMK